MTKQDILGNNILSNNILDNNVLGNDKETFANNTSSPKEIKKYLCVALLKTGPSKLKSDNPSEFLDLVRKAEVSWIDCRVTDLIKESKEIAQLYGFSLTLIDTLIDTKYSTYEDLDTELGLTLPAIRIKDLEIEINKLLVLMNKNLIITIHTERVTRTRMFAKYAESFMKKIPKKLSKKNKMTIILTRILDENNEKNFEGLRTIEEESDDINKLLVDPKTPRIKISEEIYKMKHALITYLNTLWASLDVTQSLRYGDAEILTDDKHLLARIGVLSKDLTMHISLSEHMSEVLASGMEVLQSIYNNQLQILNNRLSLLMVWLTIVGTAVLVPNTLATAFGVSPIAEHLTWQFVVYTLAISSIISGMATYYYIKHKKLIPEKVE